MHGPRFVRAAAAVLLVAAVAKCDLFGIAHAADAVQWRVDVQVATVAGLAHHDAKAVWDQLRVGDALQLVREADNAHDRSAVRVDWQGRVLGYLPAADNADVARQLDRGQALDAHVTAIAKYRNHRRRLELRITRVLGGAAGDTHPAPAERPR
ncbi:MAG: HIRAN domain-containing protein [Burkholderiales bacterium]|jgi:hypothetical protein|nr:HIRAN domain-containing protein [Burkholderiales bacterium]